MYRVIEIVKSLEDSWLLLTGVTKANKMKQKNKAADSLACYCVLWVAVY